MQEIINDIFDYHKAFDLIYIIITLIAVIQCSRKGFILSLFSMSKWFFALIITIAIVPKISPLVNNYISSEYVVNIGLSIIIFLIANFFIILTIKSISKFVKYSGLGGIDSFFGFLFGFLKGYILCVILFSCISWLYPFEKWPIDAKKSFTFSYVYNGSNYLIEKSRNINKKKDLKGKIENI